RTSLGVATRADIVPQMALRAGGLRTVRGYDFGVASGDALWALQLDVARPGNDPLKWVGFLDAGQAGKLSAFGDAPLLSGVGVGVSILGGLIRAEVSHPLTERAGRGLRFDLVFGGVR
ncbi:MAG: ShlB/FhaC/HecB family hemolysin secretion/activation protein, partial [Phycisphaerales bacterium]